MSKNLAIFQEKEIRRSWHSKGYLYSPVDINGELV